MLKHHPHSASWSVAAVSHQPMESDTLQQQPARSGICTDRNMLLKFLWGQSCPILWPSRAFLRVWQASKGRRMKAKRKEWCKHPQPMEADLQKAMQSRILVRQPGLHSSHRLAKGHRGQGTGWVEESSGKKWGLSWSLWFEKLGKDQICPWFSSPRAVLWNPQTSFRAGVQRMNSWSWRDHTTKEVLTSFSTESTQHKALSGWEDSCDPKAGLTCCLFILENHVVFLTADLVAKGEMGQGPTKLSKCLPAQSKAF